VPGFAAVGRKRAGMSGRHAWSGSDYRGAAGWPGEAAPVYPLVGYERRRSMPRPCLETLARSLSRRVVVDRPDDRTGGSRLHPGGVGLLLGAALIGELVLAGRLRCTGGRVSVAKRRTGADELAAGCAAVDFA